MPIYFCLHLSKCLEKQFKFIIFCLYFHHAFHLAGKQNSFLCTDKIWIPQQGLPASYQEEQAKQQLQVL